MGDLENEQHKRFYYAFSEKKALIAQSTKLIVRFLGEQSKEALRNDIQNLDDTLYQQWQDERTVVITTIDSKVQEDLLDEYSNSPNVVSVHPIYKVANAPSYQPWQKQADTPGLTGAEMGLTNEFNVQFLATVSQTQIEQLNKEHDVKVIKKSFDYLLKVAPKADALQVANTYYETGLTKYSTPNFISSIELHQSIPNDTYFTEQWNFHNTGQTINDGHMGTPGADIKAPEAWDITKGNHSITIAVLGEGVTSNHPDLPNSRQLRLDGSNFAGGNPDNPSPNGIHDNHGNACTGLVAATQDNNQGISGIAPHCKIMPIKIFNANGTNISAHSIADAITFAYTHGADILSNSWGYFSSDPNLHPQIVTAIQNATTQGRNGAGTVVVFSAGNTANHVIGEDGYIVFPANVNVPGVLTGGASDRNDEQAAYSPTSNPSSNQNQIIDVVAPSHRAYPSQISTETFEIWSIDMPGLDYGYNRWPSFVPGVHPPPTGEELPNTGTNYGAYTGRFGGTSAACPQVAGLAALVLSLNSYLSQQEVFNIITSNADKVGNYEYINGRSNEFGFGRVNACKTVLEAVNSSGIAGPQAFCSPTTYKVSSAINGSVVSWSVSPSGVVNLSSSGNSVTATKISSGDATLTATIEGECGIATISKEITTTPKVTFVSATPQNGCSGNYKQWYLSAMPNFANATNWHWTVDIPSSGDYHIYSPHAQSTYVSVANGGGGISVTFEGPCGETSKKNGVTIWSSPCS